MSGYLLPLPALCSGLNFHISSVPLCLFRNQLLLLKLRGDFRKREEQGILFEFNPSRKGGSFVLTKHGLLPSSMENHPPGHVLS